MWIGVIHVVLVLRLLFFLFCYFVASGLCLLLLLEILKVFEELFSW